VEPPGTQSACEYRRDSSARFSPLAGLTDVEVHALLRAAGASSHGLAARNYAMTQLMLQAGLRVGEVAALQVGDIILSDRSGSVRIRHGKGLKAREVPLKATVRRALKQHLDQRQAPGQDAALFVSSRETTMPVRTIQAVMTSLARRARLKRVAVSAHTLRHTFALGYLRDNPGKLVEGSVKNLGRYAASWIAWWPNRPSSTVALT